MKTPREFYSRKPTVVYPCELEVCPRCGGRLKVAYQSGPKTVQTLTGVWTVAHQPKRCVDPDGAGHRVTWTAAQWHQTAPPYCTYGYDVIAQVGWQRQTRGELFAEIHADLEKALQISEAQVRYLYHHHYLPLLACQERQHRGHLERVAQEWGLILSLDGLAPAGGEPQLWVVREMQTGLTLRSGWLSGQDQGAFVNFLQPIAEQKWPVQAVLSDKQKGLEPAIAQVFPQARQAFCQWHYLRNAAAPIAAADEAMKGALRQQVRVAVGDLLRQEREERPGVLTVTGLVPSPFPQGTVPAATLVENAATPSSAAGEPAPGGAAEPGREALPVLPAGGSEAVGERLEEVPLPSETHGESGGELIPAPPEPDPERRGEPWEEAPLPSQVHGETRPGERGAERAGGPPAPAAPGPAPAPGAAPDPEAAEREAIVQALQRRVRYLLTLKGRPPVRLAGIEMFERLGDVEQCLETLVAHQTDPRLVRLRDGLHQARETVRNDYADVRQAANWLDHLRDLLDPEAHPGRTGAQVRAEVFTYLKTLPQEGSASPRLREWSAALYQTSVRHDPGLFHCYDLPHLPRTNNERESEFRDLQRRLLRTTGQVGLVPRLLQREGAWELIPRPASLEEMVQAFAHVNPEELRQEQDRVRQHRDRFRLHTRSPKQAQAQLKVLEQQWMALPAMNSP